MADGLEDLAWKAPLLFAASFAVFCAAFFLPAGSLSYWNAWAYMAAILVPGAFAASYLLKHDRALLARRMRFREKRAKQGKLIAAASLLFFAGFLIPGFDYRYGWSAVPLWLEILSLAGVFLGYLLTLRTMRENSHLSRVIEVEKGQKVITTGSYSIVRHPMYSGVLLMFLLTPTALGSYWALIPILPILPLIMLRLLDEEKLLLKSLPGYRAYCRKTKFRLVPYVW